MGKIMDVGRTRNNGEGDSGYGQKMGVGLETDEKLAPTSVPAGVTETILGWQCCWGDGVSVGSLTKGEQARI